jgi:quinol monooxygenase YgiN
MAKLTIIANIKAKADQVEQVKTELLQLVEPSRADAGCIHYDLHQDNKNPAHFLVYENWESPEALQKHSESPHFKEFTVATEGAIEEFTVNEMTRIK